jgi:transposase
MKQRALELLDQGWEVSDIVDALGVLSNSITRCEDNYETFGDVAPPSGLRGHPCILTMLMTDDLRQMISKSPSLYLDEIGEWLAIYHDQPISRSALHRNLQDLALTRKKLCWVAAKHDEEFRSEWLDNILTNYSADQLVFLDKSSKDDHVLLCQYGWSTTGEDAVDSVPLDQ